MTTLSEKCEQRKAETQAIDKKFNAGNEEAKKLSNSNQQLLEQFKVANAKYEQLVELVKEEEGVEQSATEVVE